MLEGSSVDHVDGGERSVQRTGFGNAARWKRTPPGTWEALDIPRAVGGRSHRKGQPKRRSMVARESEDRIRAMKSGNGGTGPGGAKAVRAGVSFRREPC